MLLDQGCNPAPGARPAAGPAAASTSEPAAPAGPPALFDEAERARLCAELRALLAGLEEGECSRKGAARLLAFFVEVGNLASAGRLCCCRRAAAAPEASGHRSAAQELAEATGESLGFARRLIDTADALESLPVIEAAARSGELSSSKLTLLARAKGAGAKDQARLLELARSSSRVELVRAVGQAEAAVSGERAIEEKEAEAHARRSFRTFSDRAGGARGELYLPKPDMARLLAALQPIEAELFAKARADGAHEPMAAYAADALFAAVMGEARLPPAQVVLHLDAAALRRGEREADERCELAGLGPVSLRQARAILPDAVLGLVIADGVDVRSVTSLSRAIPRRLRLALDARDHSCVVPGCGATRHLEVDHWKTDFALGGPTELDNLAKLCHHHHALKTTRGWRLLGGPGNWSFLPPREQVAPGPFEQDGRMLKAEEVFGEGEACGVGARGAGARGLAATSARPARPARSGPQVRPPPP